MPDRVIRIRYFKVDRVHISCDLSSSDKRQSLADPVFTRTGDMASCMTVDL